MLRPGTIELNPHAQTYLSRLPSQPASPPWPAPPTLPTSPRYPPAISQLANLHENGNYRLEIKNPRRGLPTYLRPVGKDLISDTRGLQPDTLQKYDDVCVNHRNKPVPTKRSATYQHVHSPCTGVPRNSTTSQILGNFKIPFSPLKTKHSTTASHLHNQLGNLNHTCHASSRNSPQHINPAISQAHHRHYHRLNQAVNPLGKRCSHPLSHIHRSSDNLRPNQAVGQRSARGHKPAVCHPACLWNSVHNHQTKPRCRVLNQHPAGPQENSCQNHRLHQAVNYLGNNTEIYHAHRTLCKTEIIQAARPGTSGGYNHKQADRGGHKESRHYNPVDCHNGRQPSIHPRILTAIYQGHS